MYRYRLIQADRTGFAVIYVPNTSVSAFIIYKLKSFILTLVRLLFTVFSGRFVMFHHTKAEARRHVSVDDFAQMSM